DYNGTDGKGWPIGKGATAYAESHSHNVFWRLIRSLQGRGELREKRPPARRQGTTRMRDRPPRARTRKTVPPRVRHNRRHDE
ncbi:hypothetical protein ABZ930_41225, partial [Streptomyces sp. NPDC046716]